MNVKSNPKNTNLLNKFQLEDFEFEAIDSFKYLGTVVQANESSYREFDKTIIEGKKKVIRRLNYFLWNTNIIASTKRKIYSNIFQSIVLYGS